MSMQELFSPFGLKSLQVRNRFAMAPMTRRFSPRGVPGMDVAEYYRRRAAGGVGLIITEGTYIGHPAAGPDDGAPFFHGRRSLEGWRTIVEAVHAEGSAVIPQLWHTGGARGSSPRFDPEGPSCSPSGLDLCGEPSGRPLTLSEIDEVIEAYAEAALQAQRLGFDGVELHGAHGYLLDQFLWERTNVRSDRFGGSATARTRFPAEVIKAVRAAVGEDFTIVHRFSQWKIGDYDAQLAASPSELEAILAPLAHAGADIFHASSRRYWSPAFEGTSGHDSGLSLAGWARKLAGVPTITVGSVGLDRDFHEAGGHTAAADVRGIDRLVELFDRGEFDLVAVGRALLAHPEWAVKTSAGRIREIVPYTRRHREVLH